jgi:hypothetical protein
MDLTPWKVLTNEIQYPGNMKKQAGSLILECSFAVGVESADALTRRATSYDHYGYLGVITCPLPHHLFVDVLYPRNMAGLRKLAFDHTNCSGVSFHAHVASHLQPQEVHRHSEGPNSIKQTN